MYYIVYRIINNQNNKVYIGVHKTSKIDDGYMGSGKYIKRAINKYGVDSFTKEILFIFDNPQDMYLKEIELVNESYIEQHNTYNIRLGGRGGWDHIDRTTEEYIRSRQAAIVKAKNCVREQLGENWNRIIQEKAVDNRKKSVRHKMVTDMEFRQRCQTNSYNARQLTLTNEAKQTRKETMKKNGHGQGSNNSQFGTVWIYNPDIKENKKIKKDIPIPEGWYKGRKQFI